MPSLFPHRGSTDAEYVVKIDPPNEAAEKLIIRGLDRYYSHSHLVDALRDFAWACVVRVADEGTATYKIAYPCRTTEHSIVGFELSPIRWRTSETGRIAQRIREQIGRSRQHSQQVEVDPEGVLIFGSAGSRMAVLRETIHDLARLSGILPDFVEYPGLPDSIREFDYQKYHRSQIVALAEATRTTGWNARGHLDQVILDYYRLYRELVFQRFSIDCREEILETLNRGLEAIGRKVGFEAQIRVSGLPSREDVETALGRLEVGDGTLEDIMSPFENW